MIFKEFIEKYKGKFVEVAGSPDALNQCTDLANAYLRDVLNHPIIEWTNAVDFPSKLTDMEWIPNTPVGIPSEGDLVIWGGNQFGHIAIFIEGDSFTFRSFDQNYPTGSPSHVQNHNYDSPKVLGWLRQKAITDPLAECLKQHAELVNKCNDKDKTIENLNKIIIEKENKIKELETLVSTRDKELLLLKSENKMLMDQAKNVPILTTELDQCKIDRRNYLEENENLRRSVAQKDRRYEELKGNAPKLFLEWVVSKIEKWKKK